MADVTMKQNDTGPSLTRVLRQTVDSVQSVIALSAASKVTMYFRPSSGGNYVITASCVIASAAGGVVRHDWQSTESATAGQFNAEYEILWSDGKVETVPNDGYFSIEFVDDIGP